MLQDCYYRLMDMTSENDYDTELCPSFFVFICLPNTYTSFPACSKDSPKSYDLKRSMFRHECGQLVIANDRYLKTGILTGYPVYTTTEHFTRLYTSWTQDFSTTLVHTCHHSAHCLQGHGRRILRHAQINSCDFSVVTRLVRGESS